MEVIEALPLLNLMIEISIICIFEELFELLICVVSEISG